jgi:hypothetical protein
MAADLERPVSLTASTTDETPPIFRVRKGTETFDRLSITPSGLYTGDGTAAPKQEQPRGRFTRPQVVANPAIAETWPRHGSATGNTAILTTAQLHLVAIELPANLLVTGAGFITGTTAGGTMTNWWYVLADSARTVKAVTADQTSGAMAANTDLPLAFGTAFTTTYSGLHYVGIMVKATTVPSLMGVTNSATMTTPIPILAGTSNTGASTPVALAATLTAITPTAVEAYAYLY